MSSGRLQPVHTIAQLLNLNPRRVQQLAAEGVIPKGDRGQYDLVGCVRGYIAFLQAAAKAGDSSGDYGAQRARLTCARADMAEMEREQLRRELIPADDVEAAWVSVVGLMRSKIIGMPAKLAPRMIGLKDANAARELLETSTNEALAELAAVHIDVSQPVRSSDLEEAGDLGSDAAEAAAETDDL